MTRYPGHAKRRPVYAAIPSTVDCPVGVAGDKQASLLQLLSLHTALTRKCRNGHWINIHHHALERVIGSRYKDTVRRLAELGIIEINDRYSTGLEGKSPFTKSYRLSEKHRHGKSTLFPVASLAARRRLGRIYDSDAANLRAGGMHYRSMFDQFAIDALAASEVRARRDHWALGALKRFANREEFAKRCDYGRYHCLMTQLPRSLRRYVSTGSGERLAIVDISACQPLLLGLSVQLGLSVPTGSRSLGQVSLLPVGSAISRENAPPDVQFWLDLCESGDIYPFLFETLRNAPGDHVVTARTCSGRLVKIDLLETTSARFKKACLVSLFDKTQSMRASPIFRVIESRFPSVSNYIFGVKQQRGRHQDLACLLQRAESELMIDRVGESLQRLYPNEPVQPIHDALLVRQAFKDDAIGLIKQRFAEVGLSPRVKAELIDSDLSQSAG